MAAKLIYEDINDKFGYGEYLGFKVIIMKENGYINVTNMLKNIEETTGKRKDFYDWKRSQQAQELLEAIEEHIAETNNSVSAIFIEKGGKQEFQYLQGSYVHPKLIVHIASWASPKIALIVSDIVNGYIIEKYENKIKNQQDFINEKDEYLVIHKIKENYYYFSRVQKAGLTKAINRGEKRGYTHIKTIHTINNSLQALNSICIRDNLEKKANTIKYDGDIDILINKIKIFCQSLQ